MSGLEYMAATTLAQTTLMGLLTILHALESICIIFMKSSIEGFTYQTDSNSL